MDRLFSKLAIEAEKWFSSEPDFSDNSALARMAGAILNSLGRFRIGPAVLSLLVVFAFPQQSRQRMWHHIKKAVRAHKRNL